MISAGEFQRAAFVLRTPSSVLCRCGGSAKTLDFTGEAFLDETEAMNYLVKCSEP